MSGGGACGRESRAAMDARPYVLQLDTRQLQATRSALGTYPATGDSMAAWRAELIAQIETILVIRERLVEQLKLTQRDREVELHETPFAFSMTEIMELQGVLNAVDARDDYSACTQHLARTITQVISSAPSSHAGQQQRRRQQHVRYGQQSVQ